MLLKLNKKSIPNYVSFTPAEIKTKIKDCGGLNANYEHDITVDGFTLRMEFNFGSMSWDCIKVL